MNIRYLRVYLPIVSGLALYLAGPLSAAAETTPDDVKSVRVEEVSVARTGDQLKADLRDALRHDIDTADTMLVFNAPGPGAAVVRCRAFDQAGEMIGRTTTKVPYKGLRYVRASDLANGTDFVGSADCQARGHVLASSVFIAPGAITNLDVDQAQVSDATRIQFPVIATY